MFLKCLRDNYESVTKKSYPAFEFPIEVQPFSNHQLKPEDSGFTKQAILHIPKYHEVMESRVLQRLTSAPVDPGPKRRPYLWKVHNKDPSEMQNNGYGPDITSSETRERYRSHPIHPIPDQNQCDRNKESGFTNNKNGIEPVTFQPMAAHLNDLPPIMTKRPTGVSVMKTDYLPYEFSDGKGPIPRMPCSSNLSSGFSKNNPPSEMKTTYEECYKVEKTDQIIPSKNVGTKPVGSGFTSNRENKLYDYEYDGGYLTEYKYRYLDRTPMGLDREGHTWGGILPPPISSGFVANTKLHRADVPYACPLECYQEKSVIARDNYLEGQLQNISRLKA